MIVVVVDVLVGDVAATVDEVDGISACGPVVEVVETGRVLELVDPPALGDVVTVGEMLVELCDVVVTDGEGAVVVVVGGSRLVDVATGSVVESGASFRGAAGRRPAAA